MKDNELNVARVILVSFVILFASFLALFKSVDIFDSSAVFKFKYFSKIDHPTSGEYKIKATVLPQLLKNKKVLKDLKSYLILSENLKYDSYKFKIYVNGRLVPRDSIENPVMDKYPRTQLIEIPNDFLDGKATTVKTSSDLFNLNKREKTFIGLYLEIANSN